MAEYIDRELAIQEIQSWDNNGFITKPTRKIPQILSEKNVPTADVIERSKIDKAIEEIKYLTIYHKTTQGSELVNRKAVLRTINKYLEE